MTEATSHASHRGCWNHVELHESWESALRRELDKEYMQELWSFLQSEKQQQEVYPKEDEIFAAFNATPLCKVKVVIIGQDPYDKGQGHGLCFSVPPGGVPLPESLVSVLQEVNADMANTTRRHSWDVVDANGNPILPVGKGCLEPWAKQGVLLLNAALTVAHGRRNSHKGRWKKFTDHVVKVVSREREHVVFLLWGKTAREKDREVDERKHKVLKAAHPMPLQAAKGFFGCRHFSQANEYLSDHEIEPIDWFDVA